VLFLLFATASDWPVSLEIRGPRYPRRYETQIIEMRGYRRSRWFFGACWRRGDRCGLGRWASSWPNRPFVPD